MSENILEIRHLGKSFGTHEVLRDIDFTVKKGDVISIIGASGSGKSTLTHAKHGGKYEITLYTSCCNADRGIYYYTTYGNHQITAVDMHRENLDSTKLTRYPLVQGEQIALQN